MDKMDTESSDSNPETEEDNSISDYLEVVCKEEKEGNAKHANIKEEEYIKEDEENEEEQESEKDESYKEEESELEEDSEKEEKRRKRGKYKTKRKTRKVKNKKGKDDDSDSDPEPEYGDRRGRFEADTLKQAIEAYKSKEMTMKKVCETFNISKRTFKRHLEGDTDYYSTTLPYDVEAKIVECILKLNPQEICVRINDFRKLAYDIAEKNNYKHTFNRKLKMAGTKWYYCFLQRHPDVAAKMTELRRTDDIKKISPELLNSLVDHVCSNTKVKMDVKNEKEEEEKPPKSTNPEDMLVALEDFRTKKLSLYKCCEIYNISRRIFKKLLIDEGLVKPITKGRRTTLPPEVEKCIVDSIMAIPQPLIVTITHCRKLAYEIAEKNCFKHSFNKRLKIAGEQWYYNFIERHPQVGQRVSDSRKAVNKVKISVQEQAKDMIEKICEDPTPDLSVINNLMAECEAQCEVPVRTDEVIIGEDGKRKRRKKQKNMWSAQDMWTALDLYRNKKMGFATVCRTFNIPKATFKRHFEGKNKRPSSSIIKFNGRLPALPQEVEEMIVDHIFRANNINVKECRKLAFEIAEKHGVKHQFNKKTRSAGKTWYVNFAERYPQVKDKVIDKRNKKNVNANVSVITESYEQPLDMSHNFIQFMENVNSAGLNHTMAECAPSTVGVGHFMS